MNDLLSFLSRAFTTVVLKPLDTILFFGSGVLTLSKEEMVAKHMEDLRNGWNAASAEERAVFLADAGGALEPSFNVDGTPMVGGVDINGNPYGITSFDHPWNDFSSSFDGMNPPS